MAAIDDYALLGDTRTAALVSSGGAIDWMCAPRFDSEPVFGRLLGGDEAGTFVVRPADASACITARDYVEHAATVETTWVTDAGAVVTRDGLVPEVAGSLLPATVLVREIRVEHGASPVTVCFDPRAGWSRRAPRVRVHPGAVVCSWGSMAIALTAPVPVEPGRPQQIVVTPEQPLVLAMSVADREPLVFVPPARAAALLQAADDYWREWCRTLPDLGPFHDLVVRSLLTLRLLTYAPSGAPVAAPTTSLPEEIGGVRNWDYRYAWPRDASLGIGAFLDADCAREADAFMYWLLHAGRLDRPRVPVMLDLDGRRVARERTLDDWPGYERSRPVRVGNEAAVQHQLDVYGWILDASARLDAEGHRLFDETWRVLSDHADFVAEHWPEPDAGIWEVRGDRRHYVHSKVMAWVALDRAIALSHAHRTRPARAARWRVARDAIRTQVTREGFDTDRGTYQRAYDDRGLDAALALLGIHGFDTPDAPEALGTLRAIRAELTASGPLLYRYLPGDDGLQGRDGAFLPCSFWFAHALAQTGRHDEAAAMLEQLVPFGGPFGLFPEEIDPSTGRALGNYPQALTHSAFVQAAVALRRDQEPSRSPNAAP